MDRKKVIVNVGRQIGSGGHIVGKILAERLCCDFYDKEILNLAAKESGFSEEFFRQKAESQGFFSSFFHFDSYFYKNDLSDESLFKFQSDAIRKAAASSPCVFVGRCADYVLRDMANIVNVFITADFQDRLRNVSERLDCDKQQAKHIIESGEKSRASYYNFYTGKKWGDSSSYDLCISTSRLGTDGVVDFIEKYIDRL